MACAYLILLVVGGIFLLNTLFRWCEQTTDAVDEGHWDKLILLTCMPFAVWFFPGKVKAGRPTMPPRHQPVRGFGSVKNVKSPIADEDQKSDVSPPVSPQKISLTPSTAIPPVRVATALVTPASATPSDEGPPPGTPAEFIGMPKMPPVKKKSQRVDPEKMEMLKKKMREQGLLPPE